MQFGSNDFPQSLMNNDSVLLPGDGLMKESWPCSLSFLVRLRRYLQGRAERVPDSRACWGWLLRCGGACDSNQDRDHHPGHKVSVQTLLWQMCMGLILFSATTAAESTGYFSLFNRHLSIINYFYSYRTKLVHNVQHFHTTKLNLK